MRELERRFSPEFRNRIDEVVLFSPARADEVRQIAQHYLAQAEATLARAGKTLVVDGGRARAARRSGLQPGVRRAVPQARDRRAHQAADQRTLEGRHRSSTVTVGGRRIACEPSPGTRSPCGEPIRRSPWRRCGRRSDTSERERRPVRGPQASHGAPASSAVSKRCAALVSSTSSRLHHAVAALQHLDHRLHFLPIGLRRIFLRDRAPRSAAASTGNSRSMNSMKCVRVPSCRYITLQPTKRAPWSAIALMVRSSFDRDEEKPGTIGAIRTPALTPASTSVAHRAQALKRMRRAGLERAPRVFVHGRHAHVHGAARRCRQSRQHVAVAHDHRSLGDEPHRRPCARQRFDRLPREPVVALDRLVRVGRRAQRDQLAGPRRLVELAPQHIDEVAS